MSGLHTKTSWSEVQNRFSRDGEDLGKLGLHLWDEGKACGTEDLDLFVRRPKIWGKKAEGSTEGGSKAQGFGEDNEGRSEPAITSAIGPMADLSGSLVVTH